MKALLKDTENLVTEIILQPNAPMVFATIRDLSPLSLVEMSGHFGKTRSPERTALELEWYRTQPWHLACPEHNTSGDYVKDTLAGGHEKRAKHAFVIALVKAE